MKPIWFLFIPLIFFCMLLTGGFVISPQLGDLDGDTVTLQDSNTFPGDKSLQMRALSAVACQGGGNVAIDLVIDTSSSMLLNNKIGKLQDALAYFNTLLSPDDVIGVSTFGSGTKQIVPIDKKSVNNSVYEAAVKNIKIISGAGTPTQQGLSFGKDQIAVAFPKYPTYQKILMLITDGCPNPSAVAQVKTEAAAIQATKVRVVTVGIELGNAPKCKSIGGIDGARQLMKDIATKPEDFFEAASADQLNVIYQQITSSFGSCIAVTPTPPTALSSIAPTNPATCQKIPAIDMLVDTSGSMENDMEGLRAAMKSFGTKLDSTIKVGIQDFSDGEPPRTSPAREKLPLGNFSSGSYNSAVDSLPADKNNGWTLMKDGFTFARQKIDGYTSIPNYKDWVLIFFSDGKPESDSSNGGFDSSQDPSAIATDMRNKGMKIVTIAFGSKADRGLMQRLATQGNYYSADTIDQLDGIYQTISQQGVCVQ